MTLSEWLLLWSKAFGLSVSLLVATFLVAFALTT
jgi:hypothetical protein